MKTSHHVKHSDLGKVNPLQRRAMEAAAVRRDDAEIKRANNANTPEGEARRLDGEIPLDHTHRLRY